ncbi:sensor histidine kinase [Dielma fastidiosa]|uniref:sensor histidine kinase n=1 Tax=Dielma fastidiosa TaxID=1034346 RepID=UPI0023EFEEDF|nr:HAMP domain-containing sensor histidine kinase [Dielma fastidiosa]
MKQSAVSDIVVSAVNKMKDRRLRQTLILLVLALTVTVGMVFFLASKSVNFIERQQIRRNAEIIGLIAEKYPDAQSEGIKLFQSEHLSTSELGEEIFQKYGMDFASGNIVGNYREAQLYIVSIFLVLIALFCFAVFFIFYFYLKRMDNSLINISEYINRLLNKDYALDIIDNDEGTLSSLKNDIYKVTVMMKEQNELLKQDKMLLANNLADISHQLKTPLTSMLLMSDLLDSDELTKEERKEFLRVFKSQLKRIEWLVSSLLKLSKLDAKTIEFKKDQIHAHDLLRKAIEPVYMMIETKDQQYLVSGDNPLIETDVNWTCEAFVNILKNCSEHTPQGGILKAEVFDTVMYTEFVLSDNGVGIDAKDLPFIFDRFYRCSTVSKESVGIGLAMAYSIITGQDGTISVQSVLNQGTSFSIRFYKK